MRINPVHAANIFFSQECLIYVRDESNVCLLYSPNLHESSPSVSSWHTLVNNGLQVILQLNTFTGIIHGGVQFLEDVSLIHHQHYR